MGIEKFLNKVFPKDVFDLLTELPSGSVDMVYGDPDYNVGVKYGDKSYTKTFDEYVELVSCLGNVSYKDGEPIIHIHVSVGKGDYNLIGGHLSQPSIISITAEVFIYEINQTKWGIRKII